MNKLLNIFLAVLLTSCNFNKREVLKANLTDVGTCCSGSLVLYSNNSFKITYSILEDDFGSTCTGNYRIDGETLILEDDELEKRGTGLLISEVGDLFSNRYRIEHETLISLKGDEGLEISFIDHSFFRIPCGIIQKRGEVYSPTFIFNLCDSLLALDTVNMDLLEFDPLPHIDNCKVIFNLPEESEIIDVERHVYIYPTIWSRPSENLVQNVRLDDLVFVSKRKLKTEKPNILFYPKIELSKNILKQFQYISKDKLRHSLDNILLHSDDFYYDENKKEIEKRIWISYVDKYTEGDFYNQTNELFDINYSEILLYIKFDLNGKNVTRIFKTRYYYGN